MSILSRDRVSTALAHRQPDRVPLDFWAVPEVWEKLFAHFSTRDEETVLSQLGVDIRQVQPEYIGPPLRTLPDGTFYDPMGCHRRLVKNDLCTLRRVRLLSPGGGRNYRGSGKLSLLAQSPGL